MSDPIRSRGTIVGTFVLVVAEFLLLMGVYQLHVGPDADRSTYSRVAGAVDSWEPGDSTAPLRRAVRAAASAPGASRLDEATRAWAANPTAGAFADVRAAAEQMGRRTESADRTRTLLVALIYVTLLVTVSIGWFVWFRNLVAKQRGLERSLVEARSAADADSRLSAVIRRSRDVIAVLAPDSTLLYLSPTVTDVLGFDPTGILGEKLIDRLRPLDAAALASGLMLAPGEDRDISYRTLHADGREVDMQGTLSNLTDDPQVGGIVLAVRDVTAELEAERVLRQQATHDALTGLPNRRLFSSALEHSVGEWNVGRSHSMLFLDLDDFKDVNDAEGHGVGDELLVEVANRIRSSLRPGDIAARLGGDEFAVLLYDTDLSGAVDQANQLIETIAAPLAIGAARHVVHVSVGVALCVPGESSGEETLRNADVAMYLAKDRGKGTVAIYDAGLHASAQARVRTLADLERALEEDQLVLHFQPTVSVQTGHLIAFEALVRWQHPERGMVPPGEFIPLAERTGLIVPLGSWVLRGACRAGAAMQNIGAVAPGIGVNVAARQLADPGFVDEVLAVLEETGMPADRLALEITESVLLDDKVRVVEALTRLRGHGIRVAIDDFGTGFSSLAYLADLPVDILKIDKAFIDRIGDTEKSALVEVIIDMGRSLGLKTVAEGVEHLEQAAWLRGTACTMGQGYLWSRPVDLETALAYVENGLCNGGLEVAQVS